MSRTIGRTGSTRVSSRERSSEVPNRTASRTDTRTATPKYVLSKTFTRTDLAKLWAEFDYNGSGAISLGNIDKYICQKYPVFQQDDYKPALVRAYKTADADGSGFIERNEFALLLRSLDYFLNLWDNFKEIDLDGDRSITLEEFLVGRRALGLGHLGDQEAMALFRQIDDDGSGALRFYEVAEFFANSMAAEDEDENPTFLTGVSDAAESLMTDHKWGMSLSQRANKTATAATARTKAKQAAAALAEEARKKVGPKLSHDGLLFTAPKGTKFVEDWIRIVQSLEDLEFQSAEGVRGLRESTLGGKGGRLIREGSRVTNLRRRDTSYQDTFKTPGSLLPLHAVEEFPDTHYHTYKLKMACSPLWPVASSSELWPNAGKRMDGSVRGGWLHPDKHPDVGLLKAAGEGGKPCRGYLDTPGGLSQRFRLEATLGDRMPFEPFGGFEPPVDSTHRPARVRTLQRLGPTPLDPSTSSSFASWSAQRPADLGHGSAKPPASGFNPIVETPLTLRRARHSRPPLVTYPQS
mmetsp:Transcript_45999/g.103901  ORF Transcript_45999/g.103901 Transcript_45999/m.103901 type:complete len:522 (-) Transcript_45999:154-1719(-)